MGRFIKESLLPEPSHRPGDINLKALARLEPQAHEPKTTRLSADI